MNDQWTSLANCAYEILLALTRRVENSIFLDLKKR